MSDIISTSDDSKNLSIKDKLADALRRAKNHAPFLVQCMEKNPDLVAMLQAGEWDKALNAAWKAGEEHEEAVARYRVRKNALALVLAIGDLAGIIPMEMVARSLSDLADEALNACLADIYASRYPDAKAGQGFAILALGKHGGQELNYSSDIDPIFIYDPDTMPTRGREDAADAAQRVARKLIDAMGERSAYGYIFRMDLRLRPAAEVTPLAIPFNAALGHYESQALSWEQAAFIRSRAAAGDTQLGQKFLDNLRPFVWRRSLDFGTIDEIASLTRRIRDHYSEGLALGLGYDLKRGRGGIREVEFFTQAQQLIHGGRHMELRVRPTLEALQALVDADIVAADEADILARHYRTLRTIEHRLQMVLDQQTHSLPENDAALDNVAQLHGMADGKALISALGPVVKQVADIYDALVAAQSGEEFRHNPKTPDGLSDEPLMLADQLQKIGFADSERLAGRINGWRSGKARALRSRAGRKAFEAVLPGLLPVLAQAPNPDHAINRFEDILLALPSTINFFRLMEARPALMAILGKILSHAPVLADSLARRSEFLDRLLDDSAFDLPGSVADMVNHFSFEEAGDDYQLQLDRVRALCGEERFALGVQLIEGRHDPLEIAAGYARLAEAAVVRLADCAIADFQSRHGVMGDGGELLILAMGRLGGGQLTHASDLDLVFLYTGDEDRGAESNGARPLGRTRYYNRLAQHIVTALSVPTASGALYEVDTRLRPSGAQGLMAVPVADFFRYQNEQAWVWEHMALCRGRTIYGSDAAKAELDDGIRAFLSKGRDSESIQAEALKMRSDMAAHKPAKSGCDVKALPGGLVDLEFITHVTQLSHGEGILPNVHQALAVLAEQGLVSDAMLSAHDLLTRFLVTIRLVGNDKALPDEHSQILLAQVCQCENWEELTNKIALARRQIGKEWQNIFGQMREDI